MNYLKSKITARFVVFLTVVMVVFWSVPCNAAFGETQEGLELQDSPGSEQSEAIDETEETTTKTTTETVTDKMAIDAIDTEAVPLPDTTPPVITIIGENPVMVELGSEYADTGATAADDVDGNAAAEVTRIVNVVGKPTVATDKDGYSPGEIVVVAGSGWLPGETVKLDFVILPLQLTLTYYATAGSEGNIYNN